MELIEAIKSRRSIRGYKNTPVPEEALTGILKAALMSPSAVNHQPWECIVLTGESLERAKRVNAELFSSGAEAKPDLPPGEFTGAYRERQLTLAKGIFGVMSISREDKEKRAQWGLKGMRFYDAPAVILICADESVLRNENQTSLFDLGIVTQTIALVALEYDLGTCIQRISANYPQSLREALGISHSKRLVATLSLGYPDWDFPANALRSEREPLDSLVTWKS
ncbi:MAG: nitroreductase [Chloroflexota bacterium]|nr:nitroreductase [Chloroflexota bacterium]